MDVNLVVYESSKYKLHTFQHLLILKLYYHDRQQNYNRTIFSNTFFFSFYYLNYVIITLILL